MMMILLLISISHGKVEVRSCMSIFDKMLVKVNQVVKVTRMLQPCFIVIKINNLAKIYFYLRK